MYKEFYALKENPFNVTADPDFYYDSQGHTEAFSHLTFGISQRRGMITIIGEIGTGKTTLCRRLLKKCDTHIKSALILNPSFSATQLLQMIVHDLGIPGNHKNKFALTQALNTYLLQESEKGNNVVIIVDEAQNLGVRQLEQLRLLSNLETEKEKLLQIILLGQPELIKKLSLPSLRQLNQRISVRYLMKPLHETEIKHYIDHRLQIATTQPDHCPQFTPEAIQAIYEITNGTPRMINLLCDRALLAGFSQNQRTITDDIISNAANEVFHYEHY